MKNVISCIIKLIYMDNYKKIKFKWHIMDHFRYITMEKLKWTTPIKNGNERENLTIKSPVIYKTPVKQYETNSKRTTYQSNISSFSVLPNHITPPSGLTKFMARNPFETDLTNRLHLSVISPTVFSKVIFQNIY